METRFPFRNTRSISAPFPSRCRLVRLLFVGNGELLSATLPSPFEDHPAAAGLHAGAKAELSVPFYPAGLVCALHLQVLLYLYAKKAIMTVWKVQSRVYRCIGPNVG